MEENQNKAIATLNGNINYDEYIANITDEDKQSYLEIVESIAISGLA